MVQWVHQGGSSPTIPSRPVQMTMNNQAVIHHIASQTRWMTMADQCSVHPGTSTAATALRPPKWDAPRQHPAQARSTVVLVPRPAACAPVQLQAQVLNTAVLARRRVTCDPQWARHPRTTPTRPTIPPYPTLTQPCAAPQLRLAPIKMPHHNRTAT